MQQQLPCWLSSKDKAIADALLQAGYHYCGLTENFLFAEEYAIRYKGWRIAGAIGECVLDAECDGALFSKCMEGQEEQFEAEIRALKQLIRRTEKAFQQPTTPTHEQLSLFPLA